MEFLKILFFIFFSLRTIEGVLDVEYVESLSPDSEPPRPPPPPPMKCAAIRTLGTIASGMTRNHNRGNNAGASCSQECNRNSLPRILESSRGTPTLESREEMKYRGPLTPAYCKGCCGNTEGSSSSPQLPKHCGINYLPKCTSGEISRDMPRLESREIVKKRDPNIPGYCQGRSRDTEGSVSLPQLPKCPQMFPPTNIQNNERPIKLGGRPESSSGTKGLPQPPKRSPESYRWPLPPDLQESKGKTNQNLWPTPPTNQAKTFPSSQNEVSGYSKTASSHGSIPIQESPQKLPKFPVKRPPHSDTFKSKIQNNTADPSLIPPSPPKNSEKNLSPQEGVSNAEKSHSTLQETGKDTPPDPSKKDPSKLSSRQGTKEKETPTPSRGSESKETQNSVKSKNKTSNDAQGNEKEKPSLKPTPTPPPQTPKKKPLCQKVKDILNAPWDGWGGLFKGSSEKDEKSSKEKNKK